MKKILILIVYFFSFLYINVLHAQNTSHDAKLWQQNLNAFYGDPETSPLNKVEQKQFKGILFFSISDKYRVKAKFNKLEFQKKFLLPTSDKKMIAYKKYGILKFSIDNKQYQLFVYEQVKQHAFGSTKPLLFLPFMDLTNGVDSYGAGRYLDVEIPDNTNEIILDFNKSYNPYCAYSTQYSCPLVPEENTLNIRVEAGVKYVK